MGWPIGVGDLVIVFGCSVFFQLESREDISYLINKNITSLPSVSQRNDGRPVQVNT